MGSGMPDPITVIMILVFLGLAPFVAIMVTSYVKIVIVLSLIRNALGIQQIPPNMVINGLSIILSVYIMYPVIQSTYDTMREEEINLSDLDSLEERSASMIEPIKGFLVDHASERERAFFLSTAQEMWPEEQHSDLRDDDLMVLVPSFIVSELTAAFQIGFLIYLPFIAIDIIVSNILLALGMMMVSPMTISLPFKLLLFVVINGWTHLIHGLVLTYM